MGPVTTGPGPGSHVLSTTSIISNYKLHACAACLYMTHEVMSIVASIDGGVIHPLGEYGN